MKAYLLPPADEWHPDPDPVEIDLNPAAVMHARICPTDDRFIRLTLVDGSEAETGLDEWRRATLPAFGPPRVQAIVRAVHRQEVLADVFEGLGRRWRQRHG